MIKLVHSLKKAIQHKSARVDPERDVLKSALRTALACAICIVLFQYAGNTRVSILAGFAAFSFVQNDPQGLPLPRLFFLSGIVVLFSVVAFSGLVIGNYPYGLIITTPVLAFACAYIACMGVAYFQAGVWVLLIYFFAAANPVSVVNAAEVAVVFVMCGAICVLTCFWVFPINPYQRLIQSYRLILVNFIRLLSEEPGATKPLQAFNRQIDHLLVLQQKNLYGYFQVGGLSLTRQRDFGQLAKSLYQISLMLKSTLAFHEKIYRQAGYSHTQLSVCHVQMITLLTALVEQINTGTLPPFAEVERALEDVRDHLTAFRREALAAAAVMKTAVDFNPIFDYSNYFYHFLKLYDLLKEASFHIQALQDHQLPGSQQGVLSGNKL